MHWKDNIIISSGEKIYIFYIRSNLVFYYLILWHIAHLRIRGERRSLLLERIIVESLVLYLLNKIQA